MKLTVILLAGVALGVMLAAAASEAAHLRCHTGDAKGWAATRPEPQDLVYGMPTSFTSDPVYFESRYNCKRRSVFVRRLSLGTYEVLFPGLTPHAVVVSPISEEGVSASYHNLRDGVIRLTFRGPLSGETVAARRDVAFSVVVF